jgi:hypothetical protein
MTGRIYSGTDLEIENRQLKEELRQRRYRERQQQQSEIDRLRIEAEQLRRENQANRQRRIPSPSPVVSAPRHTPSSGNVPEEVHRAGVSIEQARKRKTTLLDHANGLGDLFGGSRGKNQTNL